MKGEDRQNVFLDFLGPDSWKTLPIYVNSRREFIEMLCESVNIAVVLTKSFCILPPAFIAQSNVVQEVMRKKEQFLWNRLIRFPLKESNLEDYFEKKQNEYVAVKESHLEFYKSGGKSFIRRNAKAIIHRNASMGNSIARKWIEMPDNSPLWSSIYNNDPRLLEKLRTVPDTLKNKGYSVTLEAIKLEVGLTNRNFDYDINQSIHSEYVHTYLKEYSAAVIRNIPPKYSFYDFSYITKNVFYDYDLFCSVLRCFGLDSFIKRCGDDEIIALREESLFIDFIDLFWMVCQYHNNEDEVKNYFRRIKRRMGKRTLSNSFSFIGIFEKAYHNKVLNLCEEILSYSEQTPLEGEETVISNVRYCPGRHNMVEIFIVHGRDEKIRNEVELFCRRIGLNPIILFENPSMGRTVIEKIEANSSVECALVLYTACDEGRLKGETDFKDRARQNVIFEHGYMIGKLGRDKVIALVQQGVEIPSDMSGVVFIHLDDPNWKQQVMRELKSMGLMINWANA